MAEVRIDLEERFDLAKDSVQQTAQTAAVLAMLFSLASLAALAAFAVGLIALYSWVSRDYGQFYGLAAIGGVLLLIAIIVFAVALSKVNSWRDENTRRVTAKRRDLARTHAQRVAAAADALEAPKITPLPPPPQASGATAASDLSNPWYGLSQSSYGAAGTLIILLLWVYYSIQLFLLGAEFEKIYTNHRGSKQAQPITAVIAKLW